MSSPTKRPTDGLRWTFSTLGVFAATLSAAKLTEHAFHYGLGPTLTIALSYYEHLIQVAFGWAEPWIRDGFAHLRAMLGADLHLYPHWKDIFVLLWLYVGSTVRVLHKPASVVFSLTWGLLVVTVTSIATGTFELGGKESTPFVAAIPISGILLYQAGRTTYAAMFFPRVPGSSRLEQLRTNFRRHIARLFVLAVLALAIGFAISALVQQPNSAMVILTAFVVLAAMFFLYEGRTYANYYRANFPSRYSSWWVAYKDSGEFRLGMMMLSVLLGTCLFIAANAGLALFGL